MNKIYIFAAMLVLACADGDKFSEEKRNKIFLDGISWDVPGDRDTLYLDEELFMEYDGEWRGVFLRQLDGYLQNFFWIIDNDTIGDFRPRRKIAYGEHFIQLSLIDIWGDTLSYSETIHVKEPLSITLLSPVDEFVANNNFIKFQYKVNGASEETQSSVYFCIGENCLNKEEEPVWMKLNGNILPLYGDIFSQKKIFWQVEACEGEKCVYSREREIWLEE
jgi:hypothetical protein